MKIEPTTHHPTEYALLQIKTIYFNDFDGLAGPGMRPGLGLGWDLARPGLAWVGLGWAGPA